MPASLVGTRRLDWLRSQREAAVTEIATLSERAADEDRDLSDSEQSACERRRAEVERLDREISTEVEACERQAQYEDLAGRIQPALTRARTSNPTAVENDPSGEVVYRSPGRYLSDFLLMRKEQDPAASERLTRYRSTLQRADQTLDQNPGIVPVPALGPVVTNIDARRPAIGAATVRPMPASGKSFTRPRVTQHTQVGVQATEKTSLASRELHIDELTVEKVTYGGYANLSWQDRDWTEPAILDILVSDLAGEYALETDAAFCTTLTAGVTQEVQVDLAGATPVAVTGEGWLAALYEAAALVFAGGNSLPNTLWLSTDTWSSLGSLTDTTGRAIFPQLGPINALGTLGPSTFTGDVAGFRVVVDANFAAGTAILGDNTGVEFYEQVGGMVSALEPTVLGTAIAYYGYAASVVVRPTSFAKIIWT